MDDRFEWDEAKRLTNLDKHGFDFEDAIAVFDDPAHLTTRARSEDEERFQTIGDLLGRIVTIIWTQRGQKRRIISIRRARDGEERRYRQLHG